MSNQHIIEKRLRALGGAHSSAIVRFVPGKGYFADNCSIGILHFRTKAAAARYIQQVRKDTYSAEIAAAPQLESVTDESAPPDDWFSYDDWEREQDKRAEYEFNYWNYGSGGGGALSCPECGSQAIEYKGNVDDPIDGTLDRYLCRTCEHWWDESDLQDTPILPMKPIGARAEFDAARADLLAAQKGFNAAHGWELIGAMETLRDAQFRYLAAAQRLEMGGGGGALDCAAQARRDYDAGHLFMRRSMRAGWDAESIMKFTLEFLNPNRAFLLGMSSFVSMGFRDHVRYWNQPYMWHDFTAQKKHSRTYFLQTIDEIPF